MTTANAKNPSYVREKMLPQAAPPLGQKGAVRWMM